MEIQEQQVPVPGHIDPCPVQLFRKQVKGPDQVLRQGRRPDHLHRRRRAVVPPEAVFPVLRRVQRRVQAGMRPDGVFDGAGKPLRVNAVRKPVQGWNVIDSCIRMGQGLRQDARLRLRERIIRQDPGRLLRRSPGRRTAQDGFGAVLLCLFPVFADMVRRHVFFSFRHRERDRRLAGARHKAVTGPARLCLIFSRVSLYGGPSSAGAGGFLRGPPDIRMIDLLYYRSAA